MSEGTAGRRVTAARVCRRFPEVFERVARGELHLCALAQHLNSENASELFEVCQGKTRRQVEQLLAVRFPRPDVREQIRRMPVRTPGPTTGAEPDFLAPRANGDLSSPAEAAEVPVVSQAPVPRPAATTVSAVPLRSRTGAAFR